MKVAEIIKSVTTKRDGKLYIAKLDQNANVFVVGFDITRETKIKREVRYDGGNWEIFYTRQYTNKPIKVFRERPVAAYSYFDKLLMQYGEKKKAENALHALNREIKRLINKHGRFVTLLDRTRKKEYFKCERKCKSCKKIKQCDAFDIIVNAVKNIMELGL